MQGNGKIDLSIFDTKTEADRGYKLDITDIRTGQPSGFWVRILGIDSEAIQAQMRQYRERVLEGLRRDARTTKTQDEIEAEALERLVVATTGWAEGATIDGQAFPFSRENAQKLYTDPRFPHVREQVERGIQNRVNFLRAPASSS
jgi:hypothetical protein